jgi:two-component system, OmpR family, response regulator RegX3
MKSNRKIRVHPSESTVKFGGGVKMRKILLVEDDGALVAGLKYSIEKDGLKVITASNVKEGKAVFSSGGFDLVILDVGLPDGTGFDLCRVIRETSRVPIIFLTACDEETNVVMGLDMGGDDYIAKPFRLRELLSRIHALLRRSSPENFEQAQIRSEGLRLFQGECRLFSGGGEIPLTPAEYRLLRHLMLNPLRTVTRSQLLEKLWDQGGDFVDSNTLTVYIRRLREKLEKDASNPRLIVTVRGIGYRWNAEVTADAGNGVQNDQSKNRV